MDNEKNFCCGCGEPIGEEHGPDCDEAETPEREWVNSNAGKTNSRSWSAVVPK